MQTVEALHMWDEFLITAERSVSWHSVSFAQPTKNRDRFLEMFGPMDVRLHVAIVLTVLHLTTHA